jgi:hypothetical protein
MKVTYLQLLKESTCFLQDTKKWIKKVVLKEEVINESLKESDLYSGPNVDSK